MLVLAYFRDYAILSNQVFEDHWIFIKVPRFVWVFFKLVYFLLHLLLNKDFSLLWVLKLNKISLNGNIKLLEVLNPKPFSFILFVLPEIVKNGIKSLKIVK